MHAFWLVLTYDLLEGRRIDDIIFEKIYLLISAQIRTKHFTFLYIISSKGLQ